MSPRIVTLPFLLPPSAAAQVLLPGVIFVRRGITLTVPLIAHELAHHAQLAELGLIRYWLTYLWQYLRFGYVRHPMEIDADQRAPQYYAVAAALLGEDWEAA